tara:strand:+ start:6565 stop:6849 length:285 start_codon:yes stop_codon:yes gene_type:complete
MSRGMDFGLTAYYHKERKIEGKVFTTTWYAMNKPAATKRAYNLRRSGWYARVILAYINNGYERYEVWYRRKKNDSLTLSKINKVSPKETAGTRS